MKHEFPEEVVAIAKRLKVTNAELDAMYRWLKGLNRLEFHHVQSLDAGVGIKNILKVLNIDDVDNTEFTEDQNQFLNSLLDGNPCQDLTEAIQWCIDQCMTIQPVNVAEEWFPADLPPKNDSMVLGEDAEGCPYIVKFLKGDTARPCNDDDCSHPDHHKDVDFEMCSSISEGFYETLEQLGNQSEYIQKHREIIQWRSIPKSN